MIKHSEAYSAGIVANSRKQVVKAAFDLYDPDMIIESVTVNDESIYSKTEQVTDRGMDETTQKLGTFEIDRWKLDGSFEIAPDNPKDRKGQVGWETERVSGDEGVFAQPYPTITQEISEVEILQAITLQFTAYEENGYPVEFTVDVYSGDTVYFTKTITDNTKTRIIIEEFEVDFPSKVVMTIKKWSRNSRRVRNIRFLMGLYEGWTTDDIKTIDVYTESTFSCLSLPYSTCTIEVYNENKRFDPYNPKGLFKSIEDRQAITVDFGLRLEDGFIEWIPGGKYFQQSGGWSVLSLTVQWQLVDVIGMLTNRRFVVPETLPTTFGGWIEAIMASLGVNFRKLYVIDETLSSLPLTTTKENVVDKFCGELLRFACMATNTWPHQDYRTGKLTATKIDYSEGNSITLDNMPEYAVMSENSAIADITFSIDNDSQGNAQEVTFPGTNTDSDVSLSVKNPFIHTVEQAMVAFASCMFEYGGKKFSVKSRGNPTSETGDIMSVQTQFNTEISARLYKQQLKMESGVMRNVPSELVQSPNDSNYKNKVVLTGSGTWKAEPGVDHVKITLVQGGTGGMGGGGGVMTGDGADDEPTNGGLPGDGGKVYITEIEINPEQELDYSCGAGGAGGEGGQPYQDGKAGAEGGETTFGQFTSANGKRYSVGFMDVKTGAVYAAPGSRMNGLEGCGGLGGKFGEDGLQRTYEDDEGNSHTSIVKRPKAGERGADGKPGCVIVEW